AFFDRMHYYLPGWEVPKMRPEFFTNEYGFITDYVAEFMREMRKRNFSDSIDKYFKLGNNLNQRDTIAVRKTVSGIMKLVYPNGEYTKEELEEVLKYALVGRRRVKEQLKKIGGMEFYDVQFSYIDNDTLGEEFVSIPEQGGGKIIPEGMNKAGHVYTVARGKSGMIGTYKIETEVINGNGKFEKTGVNSDREAKEAIDTAFKYFRANSKSISGTISIANRDYMMHVQDISGIGMSNELSLAAFVGLCSGAMNKPVQSEMAILGSLSIGGTINKVEELANVLQVCFDAGAKKIILPMSSAVDLATVPPELFAKFQTSFYTSPEDAVFKALGVV
ncbi:MAG: BREX system Lon protease-like protein BrxL, partial [Peptostreptococcaceae bacterium]